MKFFFEFVTCCGSSSISRQSVPTRPPASRFEERNSLVAPRRHRRRKRAGSMVNEWQPSLCVISEDNVVVEKDDRSIVGSERTVKRKAQQLYVRSHSEEFGRNSYPLVIPAFSPTPFSM